MDLKGYYFPCSSIRKSNSIRDRVLRLSITFNVSTSPIHINPKDFFIRNNTQSIKQLITLDHKLTILKSKALELFAFQVNDGQKIRLSSPKAQWLHKTCVIEQSSSNEERSQEVRCSLNYRKLNQKEVNDVFKWNLKGSRSKINIMEVKSLVVNALKCQKDALRKLFEIIGNPSIADPHGLAKDTILYIYESKHDWESVKRYIQLWGRWDWAVQFLKRMRERVNEHSRRNLIIPHGEPMIKQIEYLQSIYQKKSHPLDYDNWKQTGNLDRSKDKISSKFQFLMNNPQVNQLKFAENIPKQLQTSKNQIQKINDQSITTKISSKQSKLKGILKKQHNFNSFTFQQSSRTKFPREQSKNVSRTPLQSNFPKILQSGPAQIPKVCINPPLPTITQGSKSTKWKNTLSFFDDLPPIPPSPPKIQVLSDVKEDNPLNTSVQQSIRKPKVIDQLSFSYTPIQQKKPTIEVVRFQSNLNSALQSELKLSQKIQNRRQLSSHNNPQNELFSPKTKQYFRNLKKLYEPYVPATNILLQLDKKLCPSVLPSMITKLKKDIMQIEE